MSRVTGTYRSITIGGVPVKAFIPFPLPPTDPPLEITGKLADLHGAALASLGRLRVAATLIPDRSWFIYGFVRKEAVISSQIEGTQATLRDVLEYETTGQSEKPDDVEEVCNYVEALNHAREKLASPGGKPLSINLLREIHRILLRGARGVAKLPGEIRRSQNWIGNLQPARASFIPPPAKELPGLLKDLENWINNDDPLPPLIRAGLVHVQFETIHPFLDGNGRIGRLLITVLLEYWNLLNAPLLYLSISFKRRREEYYHLLSNVRNHGDWEGWISYYLECVIESSEDATNAASTLYERVEADRKSLLKSPGVTIPAVRLFELLVRHPFMTLAKARKLLDTTKPTASKALSLLEREGILRETTGKKRDRVYVYYDYLQTLTEGTE